MAYKKSQILSFKSIAKVIRDTANTVAMHRVGQWADIESGLFRQKILGQNFRSFHAFPLRSTTLAQKRRAGVDLRVMVATRTYVESIRVFRTLNRTAPKGATFRIGFHPRKRARDYYGRITDILLQDVAAIQEHGSVSNNLPARPHWAPHLAMMNLRAVGVRQSIKSEIVRTLRSELGASR